MKPVPIADRQAGTVVQELLQIFPGPSHATTHREVVVREMALPEHLTEQRQITANQQWQTL
jgi:hypothetical protein